ncbi:hypothetical protein BH11VER1_BH11VER1_41670 [soil metagenome]
MGLAHPPKSYRNAIPHEKSILRNDVASLSQNAPSLIKKERDVCR